MNVLAGVAIALLCWASYEAGYAMRGADNKLMPGLRHAKPAVHINKLDCVEAQRTCRAQKRMTEVKL